MANLALIVEYETHAGKAAEEPGCLRFEVLQPIDENGKPIPNRFLANELFAGHDALAAHRATPRWQALAEKFKVLLASRRPVLCDIVG
jgi:autoinducer 2-degrading protein